MWSVCVCVCVRGVYMYNCQGVSSCVWMHERFRTRSCNLDSLRDSKLYSLWTRYTGDSKINLWDDPKIRASSCNRYQTEIRLRNRVISCECLLSCYFLIYCRQCIFMFYSYYFMWPPDILYQYVYLNQFMRHQWTLTVFILLIWVFISAISCVVIYHTWSRISWDIPYTVTLFDLMISWPTSYLKIEDLSYA